MGATQRYKQTQQQARVITNENGYLKGMYYTDIPLPEGYVKTLVNLDIDSLSGKLTPRPGLQTVDYITQDLTQPVEKDVKNPLLHGWYGQTTPKYAQCVLSKSKHCSVTPEQITQCVAYHKHSSSAKRGAYLVVCDNNSKQYYTRYIGNDASESGSNTMQIHGQKCIHTEWFEQHPGTYLNNQYIQFRKPTEQSDSTSLVIAKLGRDITSDDTLLAPSIYSADKREPNQYYACVVQPTQVSPSTAVAQGYNMLLSAPYSFACEHIAANVINILGVIPYYTDSGELALNPGKNAQITLKAFFSAPEKYVSTEFQAKYYATSYQQITYEEDSTIGLTVTKYKDPQTMAELQNWFAAQSKTINDYDIGTYWYINSADTTNAYYVVVAYQYKPDKTPVELGKEFIAYPNKPEHTIKLAPTPSVWGENVTESEIEARWEWSASLNGTWTEIYSERIKFSEQGLTPLTCNWTLPAQDVMVRLRIIDTTPEGQEDTDIILATQTIGISVSDSSAIQPKTYTLAKCTGMCEWEQRLVLWGVPGAENMLFVSDVNNPGYFPYPNNVDTFPDVVMGVYNYGDELLVLTTDALYRLTWSTEGTGWTHTLVQCNLHITASDTPMNIVIKNMFLFKSDNQYYMMVPKSNVGVKGETTIAPISKQIEHLLENFHEEIYKIVTLLSNDSRLKNFTDRLCYYHSYVDGSNVVLNYVYDLNKDNMSASGNTITNTALACYMYVQLVYDTDNRTWLLRMFSTPYVLQTDYTDSVRQVQFLVPTVELNQDSRAIDAVLMRCAWQKGTDFLTQCKQSDEYILHNPAIRNYQYLDTGNREIDTEHKKRFREFQFKIKNVGATEVAFHTGFYVDGSERRNIIKYDTYVDKTNNEIIVQPTLNDAVTYSADGLFMPTELGAEDSKVCWTVGSSAFPGRTLWKVRMPVSGKGYTPRAELISRNEQKYELLGHSWVYRTMHGR